MLAIRPLSEKQRKSYNEAVHRINIWCGSVRSGKTYVSLIKFLDFCLHGPPGICALIGRSERTLRMNIINMLFDLLGDHVDYKIGYGELLIYGRQVYVIGASDARAEGRILGTTMAGALVDEATLLPENVWRTLLDRLSIPGAQLFATTNPDSPYHWLKKDFIDRKHELDLAYWDFHLEDNPSLAPEYVANIKKENTGVWYKRRVEGLWTIAQGAVFSNFSMDRHVIDYPPGLAHEYYIGIDYGTATTCTFLLVGYNPTLYPNMWVEKEYYWDAKKEGRSKTDAQYKQDLINFIGPLGIEAIYIDPNAVSFKIELQQSRNIPPVLDGENDVIDGIRLHMNLLNEGTLKICVDCKNLIGEYTAYVWDEQYQRRGIDKPIKAFDHALDALRYVLYTRFKNGVYPAKRRAQTPEKAWDPMGEFFSERQGYYR